MSFKRPQTQLFTFANSLRSSVKNTPETSNNVSVNHLLNSTNHDSKNRTYTQEINSALKNSVRLGLFDKQNQPAWAFSTQKKSRRSMSSQKSLVNHSASIEQTLKKHLFSNKDQEMSMRSSLSSSKFGKVMSNKKDKTKCGKGIKKEPLKELDYNRRQNMDGPLNIQIDLRSSLTQKPVIQQPRMSLDSKMLPSKCRQTTKEENIRVFVRLKPLIDESQSSEEALIEQLNASTVKVDSAYYSFDKVFSASAKQAAIFQEVGASMCARLFEGYNGTIFAYGQTGSGKTYTIFGEEGQDNHGLIYRCIGSILKKASQMEQTPQVVCSMVQLYKEQLIDMLGTNKQLKLKEGKGGELRVQGLKQVKVESSSEMIELIRRAAKSRKVTATRLNQQSSRSHTLLTIELKFQKFTTKLRLIDLAGSQKVCKSGAKGEAFEETKKINYSLSCLGNVINALTTRNKADHVPFRDSKLTRLLKQSLTGNFMTSIITNCSTSPESTSETLSSLKFAERAKKIKVSVSNLEEEAAGKESINQLKAVIKQLKFDLHTTSKQLERYKEDEVKSKAKITLKKPSKPKLITEQQPHFKQQLCVAETAETISDCDMTARQPIPSQRALVQQNIQRYCNQWHPNLQKQPHPLADFSSLNVSKSIPKLTDSPGLSSLDFKYDESPDFSLSFSVQNSAGRGNLTDI